MNLKDLQVVFYFLDAKAYLSYVHALNNTNCNVHMYVIKLHTLSLLLEINDIVYSSIRK